MHANMQAEIQLKNKNLKCEKVKFQSEFLI